MFRALKNLLTAPSKRRSRSAPQTIGIESLESRQLLAADLTLADAAIVDVEPSGANNVHITATLFVQNSGNTGLIANNVPLQAVLSTDPIFGNGDDVELDLDLLDLNLPPGTVASGNISGTVSLAQYDAANFLLIQIDPDDAIGESDDSNNQALLGLPTLPTFNTSGGQTVGKTNRFVRVDPGITFTDTISQSFTGGELRVSVEDDAGDNNILSIKRTRTEDGVLRRKGNELRLGKSVIATIAGGTNTQPLVISFTAETGVDEVERIASVVALKGKKGVPGVRNVQFFVVEPQIVTGFIASKQVSLI